MNRARLGTAALGVCAVLSVVLAVIGGVRGYSPVPFWDMWNGAIGFYLRVLSGDSSAWFAWHNEHRIVVSRLLFWIDLALFDGTGVFLIVVNFLLVLSAAATFLVLLAKASTDRRNAPVAFVVVALLFSWAQSENLTWAFQGQFFLAFLLPLWAFVFHARACATTGRSSTIDLAIACLFACLSLGTMANGVLVFPLMIGYAILARQSAIRIVALVALAIAVIWIVLHDAPTLAGLGPILEAFRRNPPNIPIFVAVYLGNPLGQMLGGSKPVAIAAAAAAGAGFLVLAFFAIRPVFRERSASRVATSALGLFVVYVVATAIVTAIGRSPLGYNGSGSTVGRYATGTLMGWAALLILHARTIGWRLGRRDPLVLALIAIGMVVLLRHQFTALRSREDVNFDRSLAFTGFVLQVDDAAQGMKIYPYQAEALSIARDAGRRGIALFGLPPFSSMRGGLGGPAPVERCDFVVDETAPVGGDRLHARFRGHLVGDPAGVIAVALVDPLRTVGFGIPAPPGVRAAGLSGGAGAFIGYARRDGAQPAALPIAARCLSR